MLSYAFQTLTDKGYSRIGTEEFENTADLFAEILITGLTRQIKQGLVKDYISVGELTSSPRGKINISKSLNSIHLKKLDCTYDEFSTNSYLNRIIKTTLSVLFKADISKIRKKKLKGILVYFAHIDVLDVKSINWKTV